MRINQTKNIQPRPFYLLSFLYIISFFALSFVISPAFIYVSADIVLKSTILPDILYFLIGITEAITYGISFAIITFTACFVSIKSCYKLTFVFGVAFILRKIADLLISLLFLKSIEIEDLVSTVINIVLYVLLFFIFTLITSAIAKKYFANKKKQVVSITDDLNLIKINYKNVTKSPINKPIFICSLIVAILELLDSITFDIMYGAPISFGDGMIMVLTYIINILTGMLCYFTAVFCIKKLVTRFVSVK